MSKYEDEKNKLYPKPQQGKDYSVNDYIRDLENMLLICKLRARQKPYGKLESDANKDADEICRFLNDIRKQGVGKGEEIILRTREEWDALDALKNRCEQYKPEVHKDIEKIAKDQGAKTFYLPPNSPKEDGFLYCGNGHSYKGSIQAIYQQLNEEVKKNPDSIEIKNGLEIIRNEIIANRGLASGQNAPNSDQNQPSAPDSTYRSPNPFSMTLDPFKKK